MFLFSERTRKKKKINNNNNNGSAPPSDEIAGGVDGEDRLTELPEPLRLHILTFLPLKYAIRTSVLSSQWRGLWAHRWLHRSAIKVTADQSNGSTSSDPAVMVSRLEDALSKRNDKLDSLLLGFRPRPDVLPKLSRCLVSAAERGIEELVLDFSDKYDQIQSLRQRKRGRGRRKRREPLYYMVPLGKFKSVVRLYIGGFNLTTKSNDFKLLRCLQYLTLEAVHITDAAFRRLNSSLSCVRSLQLLECPDFKHVFVPSSALRLEVLVIINCPKVTELTVEAPNVRSFRYSGRLLGNVRFRSVWAPLEDIYFSSGWPNSGLPNSNWVRELGGITDRVRALTFCSLALQYLGAANENDLRDFRNLRNLVELQLLMLTMSDGNLSDIFRFFRLCCCPRLEKVFIELSSHMGDAFMTKFLEVIEDGPPNSCFDNLKIIRMNNFKAHYYEVALLRFFLERAINLETVVLIMSQELLPNKLSTDKVNSCQNRLQYFTMQLSLLPRASREAEFILCEQDNKFKWRTHFEVYCNV